VYGEFSIALDVPLYKTKFKIDDYAFGTWAEDIYIFYRDSFIKNNNKDDWYSVQNNYKFEFYSDKSSIDNNDVLNKELNLDFRYEMKVPNYFALLFDNYSWINDVQEKSSWNWQFWWKCTFGVEYPNYDLSKFLNKNGANGYLEYLRSSKNSKSILGWVASYQNMDNEQVIDRVIAIRAFEWFIEFLEQCFEVGATEIKLLRVYEHYRRKFNARIYEVSVKQLKSNLNWYEEMHRNIVKKSNDNIEMFVFKK